MLAWLWPYLKILILMAIIALFVISHMLKGVLRDPPPPIGDRE